MSARHTWADWEVNILRALYPHVGTRELARALRVSLRSVYELANRIGVKKSPEFLSSAASGRLQKGDQSGVNSRFQPGHLTWNRGMRGYQPGGRAKETQFKPGHRPQTWRPIGSDRMTPDGYLTRKTSDTGCTRRDYAPVHHLVWRLHGGEIPTGHALCFRDGDKSNFSIANLELVSRTVLMSRNSVHNLPKELAQVVQLKGALVRQINRRERKAA